METVASDTTLAALKKQPSTSGILESWRDEQLELWPLNESAPCPQELYSKSLHELCQADDGTLYLLLKPGGMIHIPMSCQSALDRREQLPEESPDRVCGFRVNLPAEHRTVPAAAEGPAPFTRAENELPLNESTISGLTQMHGGFPTPPHTGQQRVPGFRQQQRPNVASLDDQRQSVQQPGNGPHGARTAETARHVGETSERSSAAPCDRFYGGVHTGIADRGRGVQQGAPPTQQNNPTEIPSTMVVTVVPPPPLPAPQQGQTSVEPTSSRWTEDELERFIDGVGKYGKKWQIVARKCNLQNRVKLGRNNSSTSLKDKWFTIVAHVTKGTRSRQNILSVDYKRKVFEILENFKSA